MRTRFTTCWMLDGKRRHTRSRRIDMNLHEQPNSLGTVLVSVSVQGHHGLCSCEQMVLYVMVFYVCQLVAQIFEQSWITKLILVRRKTLKKVQTRQSEKNDVVNCLHCICSHDYNVIMCCILTVFLHSWTEDVCQIWCWW